MAVQVDNGEKTEEALPGPNVDKLQSKSDNVGQMPMAMKVAPSQQTLVAKVVKADRSVRPFLILSIPRDL